MAWTQFLAEGLQADPVITTASDVNGRLAVDVWAVRHGLQITDGRWQNMQRLCL